MAVTTLKASDRGAYSALGRQLWKRSEALRGDPMSLNNMAWCYALGPSGLADYQSLIAGLESAVAAIPRSAGAQRHLFLNTLGAVLYRAGRYRDAVSRLKEGIAAQPDSRSPEDYVFLAMACEKLGRHADAVGWLAKVPTRSAASTAQEFWNVTELELLRNEAVALVMLDPKFPGDPFQP
jgi:tetratricopeptide (TPR) repeat protein